MNETDELGLRLTPVALRDTSISKQRRSRYKATNKIHSQECQPTGISEATVLNVSPYWLSLLKMVFIDYFMFRSALIELF